jgi:nitrate reductase molybdenum cofactor assembly chaperone NarJ/NarW
MLTMKSPAPIKMSLRVLAALLEYPDPALRAHLDEVMDVLRGEGALADARLADVGSLVDTLRSRDPLETEADYVGLFDRGRATSLHLFEHVHGDSRDRGPAMVDLARTYAAAGLSLAEGELPDYLPAVLEFASTQPPREARAFLSEIAHILNAIFAALAQRRTPYAAVLAALLELAGEKPKPIAQAVEEPLDESWAEPPAFDGCSHKGQSKADGVYPINIVRNASRQGARP